MKVRVSVTCNMEELRKFIFNEPVDTIFGKNDISMKEVYHSVTGNETNKALFGEICEEGTASFDNVGKGLVPSELVNNPTSIIIAVIEMDICEKDFVIFKRKALPSAINQTELESFVQGIKDNRVLNLANNTDNYNQIILTGLNESYSLLGVMVV